MSDWMDELKAMKERLYEKEGITAHIGDVNSILKKYGWHPVSEPPEVEGRYMVTTVEEVGFSFYNNGWSRFFIIAWMPLPDPYQPKGE